MLGFKNVDTRYVFMCLCDRSVYPPAKMLASAEYEGKYKETLPTVIAVVSYIIVQ